MSHANAALTPRHRLKVARLVVVDGRPISEVAARFQVSWPTVKRWADRYRAGESMHDRSSRPRTSPNKTPKPVKKRCVSLRIRMREGPVQLAARLGVAASSVHRILTTARLNRSAYIDRATGESIRRYEHPQPGSLAARGREEAREHPRRRWMALRRPTPRRTQSCGDPWEAEDQVAQPEARLRVRPHRHRRPLPCRVHRGPR